jgi:hypothetical protein
MDRAYKDKTRQFLTDTNRWLSGLNSAAIELMFLQRMLDIYGLKSSDPDHEARVIRLKRKITEILEVLNSTMPERLHAHAEHLTRILDDRLLLEDRELPYRHSALETALQALRTDFAKTQQEAFLFIEELKRF